MDYLYDSDDIDNIINDGATFSNPAAAVAQVISPQNPAQNPQFLARINGNNSMNNSAVQTSGIGDQWQYFGLGVANALAGTGVNILAARNGVYAGSTGQANTQRQPVNPASPRQANAQIMPLLVIAGVVYLLAKA